LVDGQYSIIDFIKYFDIELKENYQSKYTTVAGLIIYNSNTLPEIGQKIRIDNFELEVVDKDGQRIDKIMITKK
jgi:putative hemolysin